MKTRILFLFTCIGIVLMNGQMPKWLTGGGGYLDFTGAAPQFTPSSINSGTGAYDESGNILFTVTGGNINTSNAGAVNISEGETSVIRVPGKCDEWYVIGVKLFIAYGNNPNPNVHSDDRYLYKLYHAVIKMISGSPNLIGAVVDDGIIADLGYPGPTNPMNPVQLPGIAVSKLNGNNERYVYTVGLNYLNNSSTVSTIRRFIINGVSPTNSFQSSPVSSNYLPTYFGSAVRELELYESANGLKVLAWGDSTDPPNNINSYNPARLYTAAIDSSAPLNCIITNYPLPQGGMVGGLEFYNNGQNLVFSISNFQGSPGMVDYGLRTINLSNGTITPITNSLREGISGQIDNYHAIEKDVFGNYFVVKTEYIYSGPNPGMTFKLMTVDLNNLLLNPNTYEGTFLPDQVDDENYYVQSSPANDLAAFDSQYDIGLEPNPSANTWINTYQSNDIWNRVTNVGLNITHENPGYAGPGSNVMRFRVHNISCATSAPGFARLYWTMGSTGEAWPESWTGVMTANNQPLGAELNIAYTGFNSSNEYVVGQGFKIPALAPGQEYIIDAKWYPVNPAIYGVNADNVICFLGRIVSSNDPMFDENPGPNAPVEANVIKNNNIVTRNTRLVNLSGAFFLSPSGFFIGNYLDHVRNFNVRFQRLKTSSVPFESVGTITIKLEDKVWDRWKAAGMQAEGVEVLDYNNHEIIITDLQNAQLKNIPIQPKEYLPIVLNFKLNNNISTIEKYDFAVSQHTTDKPDQPYGTVCHFLVSVNEEIKNGEPICDGECSEENKKVDITSVFDGSIKFSPNPVSDMAIVDFILKEDAKIAAKVVDYYGKQIKVIPVGSSLKGANRIKFSTADLINGIYILNMSTGSESKSLQFIVKH
ncbi:T9SS type A sorting domain-containing protein [Chryseobacterium populi]|uniref:Por secretion system C-terminal sorting domain containing protein n=1 Tax=Chryseobacterium populi TaxID=1144316 RepID=J3CFU6_9FLAO|nr:T9SS type A sorting domain-containing protein [Chryseobacterium populi]EJL70839.1 Por secretion system C-terminal sorting domain containing protein [Chryseobacterium populi]